MNKNILSVLSIAIIITSASAALPFNKNLSEENRQKLVNGELVINKLSSTKEFCIETNEQTAVKALDTVKAINPVYLSEIIKIYPYEGNEKLIESFDTLITDIPSYAGIPYYSEHNDKWYDLYSSAKIISNKKTGNLQNSIAELEMDPFGIIKTQIDIEKTDNSYYYVSTNLNRLKYDDKIYCVNEKKMKSVITIFRDGDYWILYGIGAVNAPNIFFIKKRAEVSFINRIKTFCSYFFTKL